MTANFTEQEVLASSTASRLGMDNTWETPEHKVNMQYLLDTVLQPLRDKFGRIRISSGYRTLALNEAIGSTGKSHTLGQAVDIQPIEADKQEVFDYIQTLSTFDNVIAELFTPSSGWIHISVVRGQARCRAHKALIVDGIIHYQRVKNGN